MKDVTALVPAGRCSACTREFLRKCLAKQFDKACQRWVLVCESCLINWNRTKENGWAEEGESRFYDKPVERDASPLSKEITKQLIREWDEMVSLLYEQTQRERASFLNTWSIVPIEEGKHEICFPLDLEHVIRTEKHKGKPLIVVLSPKGAMWFVRMLQDAVAITDKECLLREIEEDKKKLADKEGG